MARHDLVNSGGISFANLETGEVEIELDSGTIISFNLDGPLENLRAYSYKKEWGSQRLLNNSICESLRRNKVCSTPWFFVYIQSTT